MMDREDQIEGRAEARCKYDGADMLIALIVGMVGGIGLVTFLILHMP